MKKYMFLTLALLITAATGAWAQDKNNDCADNSPVADKAVQASRVAAAGPRKVAAKFSEVELSFNCSTGYQYGVATDGEYIYTSSWSDWSSSMFYKYDMEGNFIEEFNIAGCGYIRDMTYDGEYFYGVANGSTIYQMDFENKTVVGTINIENMSMRSVTYDEKRDGFWVTGNWTAPLALYDRDGNKIQEGIYAGHVSGIAYYEDNTGEEHILQFHNQNRTVNDYNITTNTIQDNVLNLTTMPGYYSGSSGGCFIGEYNGQVCLFADIQQTPNLIGIVPITNAKPVEDYEYDITGETGKCFWGYNEKRKELTIWGDGAMANYSNAQDCPWYEFADDVETLIIKSGVTRIGHRAFYSMERLTFATIPNTVETIGNYAFYSCTRLPFISIPASVTDMGRDIFWHCYEMKNVYVYADVNVLTWTDTDCDDFTLNRNTKCHVTDADAWNEKFGESINVTFVGDLKPVPAAYANEDAFELNEGENDHGKIVFYADGVVATKAKAGAAVMVTVKPIKGYIAELVYGTGYSSWEQAQSRMKKAPTMDIIGDIEFTKLKDNVWSFAMPGSDVEISVVYRKLMTHTSIKIQNIQAVTYNGEFLKPTFTVKDGTKVLTLDTDYTVEYSNNFNAALATDANAPTLTVTGIGSYAGETTKTFTINKKTLIVTAVDTTVVYAGEPAFDVEYNGFVGEETEDVLGGELAYECDYTTESAVGSTFTITPSGLTAQNYNINFATGTLTVVTDQKSVEAMEKIDAIGEVTYTDESKALIDDAREAYDALTDAQKTLVDNLDVLTAAEEKYAELKAAADQAAADAVSGKINAIGEVAYNETSKGLIDAAREAYDALTDDQKALVNNLNVLTDAEAKYAELANIATGVEKIENGKLKIENYYDLKGRKVNGQLKKGVYIVGGHKVVIK